MTVGIVPLGQSGFRLQFGSTVVYVDPYLSDRVEVLEGPRMRRLLEAPLRPGDIRDAHWALTTHLHADHTDPDTLVPLSAAAPAAQFLCPGEPRGLLTSLGIDARRIHRATEEWRQLSDSVNVCAVPAAHPTVERSSEGELRCVGYVFEYDGRRFYHAGDTSIDAEVIAAVKQVGRIDAAFLPVNERNFQREQAGILGNMTVREAFHLATAIGARVMIPMHWDMFGPNSVFPEEIELLYRKMRPPFELAVRPTSV